MKKALNWVVLFVLFFQVAGLHNLSGVAHAAEGEFTPVSFGFEEDENKVWYSTVVGAYAWGMDTSVTHGGSRSLKLANVGETATSTKKVDVDNTKTTNPVIAPDIEIVAGKRYTLEFWYYTNNYQKLTTAGGASILLNPYFDSTATSKVSYVNIPVTTEVSSGWVKKTVTIDMNQEYKSYAGATIVPNRMRMLFRLADSTGEIYFDDIKIYEEGQAPSPSPTVTPTPTPTASASPDVSATPTATPTVSPSATPIPGDGTVFRSGFEASDQVAWIIKESGMDAEYDSAVKRSGDLSLKIVNTTGTTDTTKKVDIDNLQTGNLPDIPITGGKTYEFDLYYLTQAYDKLVASAGVVVTLLPYAGSRQLAGTASITLPETTSTEWTKQTIKYSLPEKITSSGVEYAPDSLRVLIRLSNATGTVWLDDFSMKALYPNDSAEIGQSVVQASFEEGEETVWAKKSVGYDAYLDSSMPYAGSRSLKLFNPTGIKDASYKVEYENSLNGTPVTLVEAARSYTLAFRYFTSDYQKLSADGGATITVYPYSGSNMLREYSKSFAITDDPMTGWVKKAIAFELPATIKDYQNVDRVPDRIRIFIKFVNARGTVWIDDLSIKKGVMNLGSETTPVVSDVQKTAIETRLQGSWAFLAGASPVFAEQKKVRLNDNDADTTPILDGGHLFVPVPFVVGKMGENIQWNDSTQTLTVNGAPVVLEASPRIIAGMTYIPLRAVAEALGKAVFQDDRGLLLLSDSSIVTPGTDDVLIQDMMRYLNITTGVIAKPALYPNPNLPDSSFLPAAEYFGAGMPVSTPSIVMTENTRAALDAALANFTFKHDGMMNTIDELMFIKGKIEAGQEPWASSFEKMKQSKYASKTYTPSPVAIPSAGINGANDQGAAAESMDSAAAYTQALLWIFTGEEVYAQNAVKILNGWANVMQSHGGANWYLQASWAGSKFPAAAELIRATYPGWSQAEIDNFKAMLNRAFLPLFNQRMSYGNRLLSVCNALIAIGVFNEDKAAIHQGLYQYLSYMPNYIYLDGDGDKPIPPTYWLTRPTNEEYYQMHSDKYSREESWVLVPNNPKPGVYGDDNTMLTKSSLEEQWYYPGVYINGLSSETARDLGHVELSIGAVSNIAEIAWNQGIDVYSIFKDRLSAFMELNAALRLGYVIPDTLNGGYIAPQGISPTYEIMYNHLHNRMGMELPITQQFINPYIRAAQAYGTVPSPNLFATTIAPQTNLHMLWETLTHAQLNNKASAPPTQPTDPSVIEGTLGGIFSQGAFSVQIPVNAFGGTLALSVTDSTYEGTIENGSVISSFYKAEKDKTGNFYKPVTISVDVSGKQLNTDLYDYGIYEFSESLMKWIKLLDTQVDSAEGIISGTVNHLGSFAVLEMVKMAPPEIEPGGTIPVVSAIASDHDGNLPTFAIDGDLNTRWSAQGEQWLELDIGKAYNIDSVGIAFQSGDVRASKFDLEVSADYVNWTPVFAGQSSGTSAIIERFTFDAIDARYVRYNGHGNTSNSWNSIKEVEIYKSFNNTAPAITALDPVMVTTNVGVPPVLPSVVNAVYSDQSVSLVPVVWNAVESSQYSAAGSFTVQGAVYGTELRALAAVTVVDNSVAGVRLTGPASISVGMPLQLTYGLSSVTTSVYAKSVKVHYDPLILEYTGETSLVDGFAVVGSTNAPGVITLIEASSNPARPVTGNMDLLSLHFRALATSVTTSVYVSDVVIADHEGNELRLNVGPGLNIQVTASADKTELAALLAASRSDLAGAKVLNPSAPRWGYYPQSEITALEAAVAAAATVLENADALQNQVDQAESDLANALAAFRSTAYQTAGIGDLAILSANYGATANSANWQSLRMYDYNQDGVLALVDLAAMARRILN